jgi:AraC-like DNA-binding protein
VLDLPAGVATGRVAPPADLSGFVEHFWWVRWDVPETRVSEVLSYPSVHVVFEGLEAHVVGVVRAKFVRKLEGRGQVFAVKFRPGMFRAFCGTPVVRLTDRELPLGHAFGVDPAVLAKQLLESSSESDRAELLGRTLRAAAPVEDRKALLARDLVQRVGDDRELRSVAALSAISDLSERQLQRLFRDYVGVSPKWVVRRFRLQEAAELLATGKRNIAALAAELGYYDQPHFVRDFKAVVGRTPSDFAAPRVT